MYSRGNMLYRKIRSGQDHSISVTMSDLIRFVGCAIMPASWWVDVTVRIRILIWIFKLSSEQIVRRAFLLT